MVQNKLGKAAVLVFFTALSVVGLYGTTQLYADFRLEWFIPDGSYVTSFLSENDQMFSACVPFNVRAPGEALTMGILSWDKCVHRGNSIHSPVPIVNSLLPI